MSFNHNNIWYPGATNIIEYEHPDQEDTDIVKCTYNEWLNILDSERNRLHQLRVQQFTHTHYINGVPTAITESFPNVTLSDARDSILISYPHLNIPALDKICNSKFVKCRASDSDVTPINIMGLIYKCSSCFGGFDENYTIFMCPIHSNYILCPQCHGYHAEMQIYKILKNRMISMDPKCIRDSELVRLTQSCLKQNLESINESAIVNCNKICKWLKNNDDNNIITDNDNDNDTGIDNTDDSSTLIIMDEIYRIIIEFIGKRDIIKIVPFDAAIELLDACWNSQIIKTTPKLADKYYQQYPGYKCGFNGWSTTFRLHKLSMTTKEYNKFQNKEMYQKYINNNSVNVDWNGVKSSNWIWRFFIEKNNGSSQEHSTETISNSAEKSTLNVGAMEFIPQTEQRRRKVSKVPKKNKSKSSKSKSSKSDHGNGNESESKSGSNSNGSGPNKTESSGSSRRHSSPESTPKRDKDKLKGTIKGHHRRRDPDRISERLLIGDILETLCNDNRYKFNGIETKLRDYSYAGHQYHPGGKPQVCGDGNCLIFTIGDNENFYVISQYERKSVGL